MKLLPETSPNYSYCLKYARGHTPRAPGATTNPHDHLDICYRKYTTKRPISGQKLNLVFCHGNGMNKGIWHVLIDQLYGNYPQLNTVLAFDHAPYGDLALANRTRLGPGFRWRDGAKDIAQATVAEPAFLDPNAINVIIGHLMGGCILLMVVEYEPRLFQGAIVINPVAVADEAWVKRMEWYLPMLRKRGYLQDTIDTSSSPGPWVDQVLQWFKTKLFYHRFDPQVLNNLVHDEVLGVYEDDRSYSEIKFKTTTRAQEEGYASSPLNALEAMTVYGSITVPIYHICGRQDTVRRGLVELLRRRVPVVEYVDVPGCFHLMHGEQPGITYEYVSGYIRKILANPGERPITDKATQAQFGDHYREKYYEYRTEGFINGKL